MPSSEPPAPSPLPLWGLGTPSGTRTDQNTHAALSLKCMFMYIIFRGQQIVVFSHAPLINAHAHTLTPGRLINYKQQCSAGEVMEDPSVQASPTAEVSEQYQLYMQTLRHVL